MSERAADDVRGEPRRAAGGAAAARQQQQQPQPLQPQRQHPPLRRPRAEDGGTGDTTTSAAAMATVGERRPLPSPEAMLGQSWNLWVEASKLPGKDGTELDESFKEFGKNREVMGLCREDSTKEPLSPVASKAQDPSLLSNRLMIEKQQEEAEWESINGLLMTHGFKPLCLVKGADLRDFIVFDKQSSQKMRQILKTLMEETTRQQSMIRELIETNQQLKSELQLEQNRAAHQEQRANDLQQIMDSVKSKIGELEDESLNRVCQQQNRIKDLQKEYKMLQMKCQQYKKNRMEQEGTIASLQKEIHRLAKEEEERILTQNRVFAHLCRRVPHSVLDKQLLCLIDYYECKLRKLHIQRQFEEDSQSEICLPLPPECWD